VRHDPGFREPSPVSRLDAFFVGESGGLRFTEYNAETPAGGAYNDVLTEAFYGLPIVREFLKQWDLRPLPARHNVLHALLDAYHQWSGTRTLPRIAIVDWAEVPTRNEFVLFQDYFARQGIDCVIADPRELRYAGGRLEAPNGAIDLVYKRVLITELVEREGLDHPLVRAVRDGAVCMVNPFRCKILHKKASLAVLSDERNAQLFTAEQREAIDAHIPWTRVVEERATAGPGGSGASVDLLPYIAEHRDQLVLKPNDEYGGKGIILGWEVDQKGWEDAIRAALAEPYIVQQRVALPSEPYPSFVDGTVHVVDRMVDTAPYAAYGSYIDGCLSRLSTAALLNVTAGGGSQTPTYIVDRRS
jgi:glutathionylspermidine synthase